MRRRYGNVATASLATARVLAIPADHCADTANNANDRDEREDPRRSIAAGVLQPPAMPR